VVVSPNPTDGGVWINQDARMAMTKLEAGKDITYTPAFEGNGVYLFVIEGEVEVGDVKLQRRDAVGVSDTGTVSIHAVTASELLAIEVPMFG